ncbi:MAG: hypothetical protein U0232_14295 [Thermomicrobiales bacterium]
MSIDTGSASGSAAARANAPRPSADPAQRGAAPLSSEAKRRVRFAENQRKGFESAWNEYFDCYGSTTYVEEPLIRLEDISYHLYLKKHINPTNPHWELPSFRQLKKILGLSQDKLQGIEGRLGAVRLLVKDSGKGKGVKGENVANDYLLYEPLELADFLLAVSNGELPGTLNEKGQRKLAEIRARFCPEAERSLVEATSTHSSPIPMSETVPTSHFPLPTSSVPKVGTPPAPEIDTPTAPTSGSPAVPVFGTAPSPDSGTQNTQRLTPILQQTQQQHIVRAASTPSHTPEQQSSVVVAAKNGVNGHAEPVPGNLAAANADSLVERGITPLVARRLRQSCPAERIARQVAIFDFLREQTPDDTKLTPGRLRRQIEEDWTTPAEFVAAERTQLTEVAAQRANAERVAATDARLDRARSAAIARQNRLAAIGLGEDDQLLWARIVQAAPVLPPLFRTALFHAPQGDGPAAIIFPTRADCDRALGPTHAATRTRVASRLAAVAPAAPNHDRAAIPIRYLVYDDLLALMRGDD